jgi:hypothetical protein
LGPVLGHQSTSTTIYFASKEPAKITDEEIPESGDGAANSE